MNHPTNHHNDDDDDDYSTPQAMDSSDDDDDDEHDPEEEDDGPNVDLHDDDVDIGFRNTTNYGRKQSSSSRGRRRNQDEALYGVFYESDDDGGGGDRRRGRRHLQASTNMTTPAAAPMFVAAKREQQQQPQPPSTDDDIKQSNNMSFVKAATTITTTPPPMATGSERIQQKQQQEPHQEDDPEALEAQRKAAEKQKQADDYFLSLLNKAKESSNNNKRRTHRVAVPPATTTSLASATTTTDDLDNNAVVFPSMGLLAGGMGGLGRSLPMSFGSSLYHDASSSQPPPSKDPSIAKWEKHTKGIGSKLLGKMGWKGSGGLGSNRRKQDLNKSSNNQVTLETDVLKSAPAAAAANDPTKPGAPLPSSATGVVKPKKGISRPVEVVVRPANLGLGFGNFKEATQLKSNRQLEAEVRGIDLEAEQKKKRKRHRKKLGDDYFTDGDDDDDNDDDDNDDEDGEQDLVGGLAHSSSSIPSTSDLLQHQSWKRSRRGDKKLKQQQRPEIVPYKELLQRQQDLQQASGGTVIIDMRGPNYTPPNTTDANSGSKPTTVVPLGEELLYNMSFLLNTYENKLHSSATFAKSTQHKVQSIDTDIQDLERRYQTSQERVQKMGMALRIVHQVKQVVASDSSNGSDKVRLQVQELVLQLERQFTKQDQEALQFWTVLAPTLLCPAIESTMDYWNPLDGSKNGFARSKKIIDSFFEWSLRQGISGLSSPDVQLLCESLVLNQLVLKLKSVLESTKWNPITQSDVVLDVYEYLYKKCLNFDKRDGLVDRKDVPTRDDDDQNVLPSMEIDEESFDGARKSVLAQTLHKDLVLGIVYPKLQTAISRWKPSMSQSQPNTVQDRIDTWVLPWIPHLDQPALLPNLLADCKRKIKSTLAFLQRRVTSDKDFVETCLNVLKPWRSVFDSKSLQRMMEDNNVTSRLSRFLSQDVHISIDAMEQDWSGVELLFELHARSLLSDVEFLSTMEADVLIRWALTVYSALELSREETTLVEAATSYLQWKRRVLMVPEIPANIRLERSKGVLRKDDITMRIFFTVLSMIQLASFSQQETAAGDHLEELEPQPVGYRSVVARRSLEEKQKVQEAYVKMDTTSRGETTARIRLQRRNVAEPTFRDVVEELARERDIVFQPRMGSASNVTKDGKQVFLFGSLPMYMEGDVVFCHKESSWKPVSVDQLVEMASKS